MAQSALRRIIGNPLETEAQRMAQAIPTPVNRNFVRRYMMPENFPAISNPDGTVSTHRMASAEVDGRNIAYPTIIQDPATGKLTQIDDDQAFDYALRNNEYLTFPDQQSAQAFSEGGYKSNGMNPPRNMQQERMDARRARIGMEPYDRQAPTQSIGSALRQFVSLDAPQDMSLGATVADMLMGFAPGIGTAQGIRDFERARRDDDTLGMVLGGVGAIPIAGGIAKTGKAVIRAAKGAVHPRVSEYAASAGFDPRILQAGSGAQTSGARVADIDRVQQLKIDVSDNRLPTIPAFNIADYEGYPIMTSMSDRAAAGDFLRSVNDIPVDVNRRGGQDFMFDPLNTGKVWASDKAVVLGSGESRMLQMAKNLKQKTGRDPLFAPWTMAPTGVDYSTMTGETMLKYAQGNMNKSVLRSLDKDIKKIIPDWAGINDPASMDKFYQAGGDGRKAIIQLMDKKYRDRGALTSGEARLAVTDMGQYLNPDGTLRNVGQISPDVPAFMADVHPTYNAALGGAGVGRFQEPVQVYELFPAAAMLGGFNPMAPPRNALRSLEMKPWSTIITQDLIKGIQARRQ